MNMNTFEMYSNTNTLHFHKSIRIRILLKMYLNTYDYEYEYILPRPADLLISDNPKVAIIHLCNEIQVCNFTML